MDISLDIQEFHDFEKALTREWIETDLIGNYASSSILGLNTRKNHGLFVLANRDTKEHQVLLSHLQEDYFNGDEQYYLYSVEYEGKMILSGAENQLEFRLEPFPTFIYQCGEVRIQKSVFLVPNMSRAVFYYKVTGQVKQNSRLVIRPFFAFRLTTESTVPKQFVNYEFFGADKQLRFLPFPDAPEVFIYHSAGDFVNAFLWYHNFFYRHETGSVSNKEDLLNPGFFEIPVNDESEIFLSMGLAETNYEDIQKYYNQELERRSANANLKLRKNKADRIFLPRLENLTLTNTENRNCFVAKLPSLNIDLSAHCFIARRALCSGVSAEVAEDIYQTFLSEFNKENISDILKGKNPNISYNWTTPFFLVYFLYKYHLIFQKKSSIGDSLEIILEIVKDLNKNRLPGYRLKKGKILELQSADIQEVEQKDYKKYFPVYQDFLLNVFWYNILKMADHLAKLDNHRNGKHEKLAEKVRVHFLEKFEKYITIKDEKEQDDLSYLYHPTMIFAITLPFPILDEDQTHALFTLLIKKFMATNGIMFPVKIKDRIQEIVSPILLGEYLDAWHIVMPKRRKFYLLFKKISERLHQQVMDGMVGYLPDNFNFESSLSDYNHPASGLSTSAALYFFSRLEELKEKHRKK